MRGGTCRNSAHTALFKAQCSPLRLCIFNIGRLATFNTSTSLILLGFLWKFPLRIHYYPILYLPITSQGASQTLLKVVNCSDIVSCCMKKVFNNCSVFLHTKLTSLLLKTGTIGGYQWTAKQSGHPNIHLHIISLAESIARHNSWKPCSCWVYSTV